MQHQIRSRELKVSISSHGAEINSITDAKGIEYIWQGDKTVWARHAPVLFPIVGALKENHFRYNGKSYELNQHGFARDLEFKCIQNDNESCWFELKSGDFSRSHYPFEFTFRIGYHLSGNKLTCSYTIENPSFEALLFSVGAHPGFNCPFQEGEAFEDYYLEFERNDLYYSELALGLRTSSQLPLPLKDRKLPLSRELFDRDAFVFENNQVNQITLGSKNSSNKISMDCTNWPYFGLWSKKGCDRFVCLEPWYGVSDLADSNGDLQEKEGIITLAAGKEFACHFSIQID